MKVELITITPDCEAVIEEAGRLCYKSKFRDPTIIRRWIKSGHLSLLEHASITFKISGVSRSLTHQLVRHRTGKFSQKSQRYVEEGDFQYVIPDSIRYTKGALDQYEETMGEIQNCYLRLIALGIKKEDCRFILPNACCTEIICTFDFRNLRGFLELRLSKHAQWEIRQMAMLMLAAVGGHAPNCFYDMEVSDN